MGAAKVGPNILSGTANSGPDMLVGGSNDGLNGHQNLEIGLETPNWGTGATIGRPPSVAT